MTKSKTKTEATMTEADYAGLTEEQFLDRCRLIYRTGHARPAILRVLERAADALMRYTHFAAVQHLAATHQFKDGPPLEGVWRMEAARQQRDIFDSLIRLEVERVTKDADAGDGYTRTLANDRDGYKALEIAAILTHPCQICATSTDAWWTRSGFCDHGHGFFTRRPEAEPTLISDKENVEDSD